VGFAAYARVTPEGLNQREQDLFDAFARVVDLAIARRVDVVLHSGDLFDSVRPTNRALSHVLHQARRLHDARIPFVVISGNHEAPRLRETGAVLRLLDFMPGTRAVYKGAYEAIRIGELAIHAVPHAASNDALREQLRLVRPAEDARWNVAAMHAGVLGVGDFRTGEFNEQVVPQNELPAGMDYTALGHYHRCVEVAPGAWYAGSTERVTFREAGETKSVNVVDLASGAVETAPLEGTRPMLELPVLPCRGMDEAAVPGAVYARLADAPLDGAIAKLKVLGVAPHVWAMLDFARVRKLTAAALHFELQPEIVRSDDAGAGAAAGATLGALPDEFEAFLAKRPVEADKDALLATAKALLREAESV
jgi:DNA repair exonuclease SbcCD nuclease subunit